MTKFIGFPESVIDITDFLQDGLHQFVFVYLESMVSFLP